MSDVLGIAAKRQLLLDGHRQRRHTFLNPVCDVCRVDVPPLDAITTTTLGLEPLLLNLSCFNDALPDRFTALSLSVLGHLVERDRGYLHM